MGSPSVSDFYNDKGIFITGTTGFLAKILLEKLLFSCHGLKVIYILIRPKGGNVGGSVNEDRFKELLESKAFDRIRDERPDTMSKIIPVWGDVTQPGLGLSNNDREMLIHNATIIFHSAATTKFNAPLKVALEINLIGTKNVFEVYQSFDHKETFVYISTAYSNCQRDLIEETVYPSTVNPQFLIDSCQHLERKALDSLFDSISEGRPNTYTFSKAMAESYLQEHANGYPVAIVRPSIVQSSLNEPLPGWFDSKNSLTHVLYVIGLGLIHCVPINGDYKVDLIPLDMVCNLIIVVPWSFEKNWSNKKKLEVYNCVSSCDNTLTFERMKEICLKYGKDNPKTMMVCYPHVTFTRNPLVYVFIQYYHHYLPGFTLDALRMLKGKRPKYLAIYRRYFSNVPFMTYFMKNDFTFKNENVRELMEQLQAEDKVVFNFDVRSYEWERYLNIFVNSIVKIYIPDKSLTDEDGKDKKHWRILYLRMVLFNSVFAVGITGGFIVSIILPIYNHLINYGE